MGWLYTTCTTAAGWDWAAFANTFVAALLGTGVGGIVVFASEILKRKRRLEDEQVTATNVAIFALRRAYSDLETFRRLRVAGKGSEARWYKLAPGNIHSSPLSFDVSTLAFLFEGKTPDIPAVIQSELDRYQTIRADISDRTRIHVNELQPRMEAYCALDPSMEEGLTEAELIGISGLRIYQTLEKLTDAIVREIDLSIPEIVLVARDLRAAAKAKFPKNRKIIRFGPKKIDPQERPPEGGL